jgi:hypothetical protein
MRITDSEKKEILEMHSKMKKNVILEQANSAKDQLQGLLDNKCVPFGTVVQLRTTNPQLQFAIKQESKKNPGQIRYLFIDNSIGNLENGKIVYSTNKWKCSAPPQEVQQQSEDVQYNIAKAKEDGWREMHELRKENVDTNRLDVTHDKQQIGNVILYRTKNRGAEVNTSLSSKEINADQQSFVDKWEKEGYRFNVPLVERGTLTKITPEELGAPKGLFPAGSYFYYDPSSVTSRARKGENELELLLKAQTPDRGACKDYIKDYYRAFTTSAVLDQSTMTNMRNFVQKCSRTYKGKWGLGGKNFDEMLDRLSFSSAKAFRIK